MCFSAELGLHGIPLPYLIHEIYSIPDRCLTCCLSFHV